MPSAVIPYRRKTLKDDELPPDVWAMLSVVFGLMGTLLKNKAAAWMAFFTAMASLSNMRYPEADMKQILCSCAFSVMAVVTSYLKREFKELEEVASS